MKNKTFEGWEDVYFNKEVFDGEYYYDDLRDCWNHQQQKLDECNKTMSRQLTDIKMLHKELDTKDARIMELDCRLLVESDNNRIAEHRIKELKNEIGKWLSHVTKLDDNLETLREINSAYKKADDDLEASCLVGEILDRPEVKALLEKDKV